MKKIALVCVFICVFASSAFAELHFIQDSRGITSHVLYNGTMLPVQDDGTVLMDGHRIPISQLLSTVTQPQPVYQPPTYQPQTSSANAPTNDYRHTKNATRSEVKREVRRALGSGTGSSIGGAIVDDLMSIF